MGYICTNIVRIKAEDSVVKVPGDEKRERREKWKNGVKWTVTMNGDESSLGVLQQEKKGKEERPEEKK